METKAKSSKSRELVQGKDYYTFTPSKEYVFSTGYKPPERPPPTEKDLEQAREQHTRTAKLALAYYNARHRVKYELVEAISSNGFIGTNGLWFHNNFKASLESRVVLFFGEVKIVRDRSGSTREVATTCRPLTGAKTKPECCWCKNSLLHPIRGFRQGVYEHRPRNLRRRSGGKVVKNLA